MRTSDSNAPRANVTISQAVASSNFRPATKSLADILRSAPADPSFDLEKWNREWSAVESEMEAITRANTRAESREE